MGTLRIFTMAVALVLGNGFFPDVKPRHTLTKTAAPYEIVKLLEDHTRILEKEIKAEVKFSLNTDREISVHSVLTREEAAQAYVIEKLQGQKLFNERWCVGREYRLPVKIEEGK